MQRDPWMRPRVAVFAASLGLLLSQGCEDDDPGDRTVDEIGEVAGVPDPAAWEFAPLYAAPNMDDDDQDGTRDWSQAPFEGDDEIRELVIPASAYAPGDRIRLSLAGALDEIRVWHRGEQILGGGGGGAEPQASAEIAAPSGDVVLAYEFGGFYEVADLTLERVGSDGNASATTTIEAVSSPLILNHHLQPAEHLWIVATNDNLAFVAGFEAALGDDVTAVPGATYQYDRWIQDEIEFGYSTAPDEARLNTVIDSIRDRGLDGFPEDYFSEPDWYIGTWGDSADATTFDSFGNLDASPPIPGYPFGRVYYGREGDHGLDAVLAEFLAEQTLQDPFPIDTNWLCVGHVDEFSSFVPDPSSDRGFKLLLASTSAAYELFEGLDPSWKLDRYAGHYGYATVADLLADEALRALNEDIQTNELDPLRARFEAELGLTDEDIIEIPELFEQPDFCATFVVALMPDTVNLTVANLDAKGTVLMVPDPFARPEELGPEDDPVAQDFVGRVPADLTVAFVDDWYSYHVLDGEVHCGTNVTRTPIADWTTDGAELLNLGGAL